MGVTDKKTVKRFNMIAPCERSETQGKDGTKSKMTLSGSNEKIIDYRCSTPLGSQVFGIVYPQLHWGLSLLNSFGVKLIKELLSLISYHYLTPSEFKRNRKNIQYRTLNYE